MLNKVNKHTRTITATVSHTVAYTVSYYFPLQQAPFRTGAIFLISQRASYLPGFSKQILSLTHPLSSLRVPSFLPCPQDPLAQPSQADSVPGGSGMASSAQFYTCTPPVQTLFLLLIRKTERERWLGRPSRSASTGDLNQASLHPPLQLVTSWQDGREILNKLPDPLPQGPGQWVWREKAFPSSPAAVKQKQLPFHLLEWQQPASQQGRFMEI